MCVCAGMSGRCPLADRFAFLLPVECSMYQQVEAAPAPQASHFRCNAALRVARAPPGSAGELCGIGRCAASTGCKTKSFACVSKVPPTLTALPLWASCVVTSCRGARDTTSICTLASSRLAVAPELRAVEGAALPETCRHVTKARYKTQALAPVASRLVRKLHNQWAQGYLLRRCVLEPPNCSPRQPKKMA